MTCVQVAYAVVALTNDHADTHLFRMLPEIEVPSHGLALNRSLVYVIENVPFRLVIVSYLCMCDTNRFTRVPRGQPPLLRASLPRQRQDISV